MNLVIFDMDGTLVDSAKAITNTINTTRKELDLKPNLESDFIVKRKKFAHNWQILLIFKIFI